jgi:hypothetical protein
MPISPAQRVGVTRRPVLLTATPDRVLTAVLRLVGMTPPTPADLQEVRQ